MSPPRRPGTPGSPVLPLLGTAAGTGPGGRRGLLPYALLLLAGFLLVNLFSSSGAARGGGGDGGGPLGWGNGSSWNASSDEVLSLGLQLEPPASAGCDCSGRGNVGRGQGRTKGLRGQGAAAAGGRAMVDDEAADGDAAADGDGQPPPWLGAGRPPRGPARKRHVRVVIRVHHLQEEATRSLIWALRGQTQPGAEKERFSVDFALVATERKGLPVVRRIAREMWAAGAPAPAAGAPAAGAAAAAAAAIPQQPRDVFVADTPEPFYELAANRSAPFRCSAQDRARYEAVGGEAYVRLHCAYDNHAYYQATDVAVLDAVRGCGWCSHVLVTNSDNGYHPDFLAAALAERADLVTTDFIDHGVSVVSAEWRWGEVDLGGVLASKAVVARTGGFIASLPPHAGPQETHDNDYWFVHKALELGATTAIIRRFLFFHN